MVELLLVKYIGDDWANVLMVFVSICVVACMGLTIFVIFLKTILM